MKNISIVYSFLFVFSMIASSAMGQSTVTLTLEQALELLQKENISIKIANKEIDAAKSEHGKSSSFWYPTINISAGYALFSNDISITEKLQPVTDNLENLLSNYGLTDQTIHNIFQQVGQETFTYQLFPNQMATIDANLMWPIFTGLKRVYGNKVTSGIVDLARENSAQIDAAMQVSLVDTYFGLRLGKQLVKVREQTLKSLEQHYREALSLEENGMINKADRLFVQVSLAEARREYNSALDNLSVAENAFKSIVMLDTAKVDVVTPLFICDSIPGISYFKEHLNASNHLLRKIDIQSEMAMNTVRMGRSAYAPEIALIGKQTIYSWGIPRNMVPRSMIGVGLTWNIFDGLVRENNIREAKVTRQSLELSREKSAIDLGIGVEKFYTQLENALEEVHTLDVTLALSRELVRMRRKAFLEGMSTSSDVVDAEVMLSKVEIAMLMAYYQYDVALMNLCAICGIPTQFYQFMQQGKVYQFNEKK